MSTRTATTATVTDEDHRTNEAYFRKNEILRIPFTKAFDSKLELFPLSSLDEAKFVDLVLPGLGGSLDVDQERMAVVGMKCNGPWDVEVADCTLELAESKGSATDGVVEVKLLSVLSHRDIECSAWKSGHIVNFVYHLKFTCPLGSPHDKIELGNMHLKWRKCVFILNSFKWVCL